MEISTFSRDFCTPTPFFFPGSGTASWWLSLFWCHSASAEPKYKLFIASVNCWGGIQHFISSYSSKLFKGYRYVDLFLSWLVDVRKISSPALIQLYSCLDAIHVSLYATLQAKSKLVIVFQIRNVSYVNYLIK